MGFESGCTWTMKVLKSEEAEAKKKKKERKILGMEIERDIGGDS